MFEKITYILLLGWAKANALLPFRVLYLISDFLYFLIYKVIRYRVKVVRRNMKASFPEKSEKELLAQIKQIQKKMQAAAAELNFELAAQLRDQMMDLKKVLQNLYDES